MQLSKPCPTCKMPLHWNDTIIGFKRVCPWNEAHDYNEAHDDEDRHGGQLCPLCEKEGIQSLLMTQTVKSGWWSCPSCWEEFTNQAAKSQQSK